MCNPNPKSDIPVEEKNTLKESINQIKKVLIGQ